MLTLQVNTYIQLAGDMQGTEVDTRQRILTAALQIFLEKGYAAATTRAIANQAGVNEVTLFRHFGNKQNLLVAIIERYSPVDDLKALISSGLMGEYEEDLRQIARHIVTDMTEQPDIMPLVLFEAHQIPELREVLENIPRQILTLLIGYFEQQIAVGNIRRDLSPILLAQSFFFQYASLATVARMERERKAPSSLATDVAIDQLLDIFLHGVGSKN